MDNRDLTFRSPFTDVTEAVIVVEPSAKQADRHPRYFPTCAIQPSEAEPAAQVGSGPLDCVFRSDRPPVSVLAAALAPLTPNVAPCLVSQWLRLRPTAPKWAAAADRNNGPAWPEGPKRALDK